ncbi:MAG: HDIG domain-containing protein [bacterium]|nr:HDIG domain-containing protein [bacterium]
MGRKRKSRPEPRSATRIERGLKQRAGWWDKILELPSLWAILAIVICTWLLLPREQRQLPVWEPGAVAAFDVVIASDMSLPDEAATESVREEARARVLPVYDFEPRLSQDLTEGVDRLFVTCQSVREAGQDPTYALLANDAQLELPEEMEGVLNASECSAELADALIAVVQDVYREQIVDDARALERASENGITVRNLANAIERTVYFNDVSGAIDLRTGVEPALRAQLIETDAVRRRWIKPTTSFLEANILPNLMLNRAETARRIQEAAEQVTPRSQMLKKGQVLIRRGDTVSRGIYETLHVINQQRQEVKAYSTDVGIALLVVLMVIGWWRMMYRFSAPLEGRNRLSMVLLLTILFSVIMRFTLFLASAVAFNSEIAPLSSLESYLSVLPHAAGPMVVLLLLGIQAAALFALFGALITAIMLGGDFVVVVYALAAGLAGALAAQYMKDRTGIARLGAIVGLSNMVVAGVLQAYQGFTGSVTEFVITLVAAFISGPLSAGIAGFVLPLLERLFGIATDIRLLELSNQNLPLLKRLSLAAPGTYQHSLAVGHLAEAGGDSVGANSLLLRVCAAYHDVGKLVKPEYFVENQRGTNPHDTLSPSMSALVIMSHVKEGLEIARREKLPLPVRQAIATHHGNKLIRYFYSRAKEQSDPDLGDVSENEYRYPGPRPHTKELGILLLADAVEAAARTLDNPAPSKIQNMISKIFSDILEDGQLDKSELTFKELDKIASAFLWVLTNMYHHRIDYPGFDFNRRQGKRDSGAHLMAAKTDSADG